MTKKEIKENLRNLHNAKEKEDFLQANNIPFTHDSSYNLIIWAEDGALEFCPVCKGNEV